MRDEFDAAHVLVSRALVLGAESVSRQDWEIAKRHISLCEDCREKLGAMAELAQEPLWSALREGLHPSIEELISYSASDESSDSLQLDDFQRTSIREHLSICHGCSEAIAAVNTLSHTGFVPDDSEPLLERFQSRICALIDLPFSQTQRGATLSPITPDIDVREISLQGAFGVSKEQLEHELPWCGPVITMAQTFTEPGHEPTYSALASDPTRVLFEYQRVPNKILVISLRGPHDEICTARLTSSRRAAMFEGCQLPADLSLISVELTTEEAFDET